MRGSLKGQVSLSMITNNIHRLWPNSVAFTHSIHEKEKVQQYRQNGQSRYVAVDSIHQKRKLPDDGRDGKQE